MEDLLLSLKGLVTAAMDLLIVVAGLLLPFTPLFVWVVFWLFGVDWVKLRKVLLAGGWIGILLIGVVMILVWGTISPPSDGTHWILGLKLSNYVGKTVYVTTLFCIMFLCGSVQLAGFCGSWCCFADDERKR